MCRKEATWHTVSAYVIVCLCNEWRCLLIDVWKHPLVLTRNYDSGPKLLVSTEFYVWNVLAILV